jgi:hypothetical protein
MQGAQILKEVGCICFLKTLLENAAPQERSCLPVHAVVEKCVLEELEAALNCQPLPNRCIMHLLDQPKKH